MTDFNATGASAQLPNDRPGTPGREAHERQAAFARGESRAGEPNVEMCAPDLPGLRADLIYTLVADNVRDYAIFLMDANGIIRCWGEGARLMKWWTRQQTEGAHLRMLYSDGGSEDGTAEEHLERAAATGEYSGEGHRVRRDGSTFWAYVTLTALRNADGVLVGFSKVTRDFTARRAVEAALQQPESHDGAQEVNRLRMLVASVSHELRSPLNAMLGYVALLQQGIGGPERQRAHIEKLQRSGRHLLDIIGDVLDLSRADAGTLSVSRSVRRLGPAIQEAVADVEPQAAARGVRLTNKMSGGAADLPYLGDERRVRQILVNLLTNAIKFTERDGRVTISGGTGETVIGAALAGPGPWSFVRIEDTGRGIPPDSLEAIFEPYQQSEAGDQTFGTGLGLSISRELARLMGGDLTVQSEAGCGSTFTLWLPIAPSEPIPR
jgi:PAS domain S-box-containing protein